MRTLLRLAILGFTAAIAAAPAAAQMEGGSYLLVEVDGQPVPAPSPNESSVVMHKAVLLFTPEGRFFMQAKASLDGAPEQVEEEMEGTWSVTGDSLALTPDGDGAGDVMRFRFTLAEGTLRLYDDDGHEYTFRRS
jgi:hypothetical protein